MGDVVGRWVGHFDGGVEGGVLAVGRMLACEKGQTERRGCVISRYVRKGELCSLRFADR